MFFIFNQEAVNWFCSSVAQGFLALLAIIASIGLYLVKNISDNFLRIVDQLPKKTTISSHGLPPNLKKIKDILYGEKEAGEKFNKNMESVTDNILPLLILIIILVLFSLLVLIFTGGFLRESVDIEKNLVISIILCFIFLWSIYCLYELLNLFSIVFNLRYRTR